MTEPLLRVKDLVKHFAITGGVLAREVNWSMPSRTSVTSLNITVAPARTKRSVQ